MKEIEELAKDALMPLLKETTLRGISDRSRRTIGSCPEGLEKDKLNHCWKFVNEDPNAYFDFYFIVTIQAVEDLMLITQTIPLDRDLIFAVSFSEYLKIEQNKYIREISNSYKDFIAVKIEEMKIREFYEGIWRTLFTTGSLLRCYSLVDGKYVKKWERTSDAFQLPLLPFETTIAKDTSKNSLNNLEAKHPQRGDVLIYFKNFERLEDGRIVVWDGELQDDTNSQSKKTYRSLVKAKGENSPINDGIYVSLAKDESSPLIAMICWMAIDGQSQIIFGFYCKNILYQEIRENLIKKVKKGLLSGKKTIKYIRDELKIEKGVCKEIP
jgi:hypothetical protein